MRDWDRPYSISLNLTMQQHVVFLYKFNLFEYLILITLLDLSWVLHCAQACNPTNWFYFQQNLFNSSTPKKILRPRKFFFTPQILMMITLAQNFKITIFHFVSNLGMILRIISRPSENISHILNRIFFASVSLLKSGFIFVVLQKNDFAAIKTAI